MEVRKNKEKVAVMGGAAGILKDYAKFWDFIQVRRSWWWKIEEKARYWWRWGAGSSLWEGDRRKRYG